MSSICRFIIVLFALATITTPCASEEPAAENDWGRPKIGGSQGKIVWQSLLDDKNLLGGVELKIDENGQDWTRQGDTLIGQHKKGPMPTIVCGDSTWQSYEISTKMTPLSGGNAMIRFRVSEDGESYYMLDFLMGWRAIAISKVDPKNGVTKLDVVSFPTEGGREYDIQIAARDASLTSYIDGKLINRVTDHSLKTGGVGMHVWKSRTAYRAPKIRHLYRMKSR